MGYIKILDVDFKPYTRKLKFQNIEWNLILIFMKWDIHQEYFNFNKTYWLWF